MDKVKVVFLGPLRSVTNDEELEMPVTDRETVRTLLSRLNEKLGQKFRDTILDSDGQLRPNVIVLMPVLTEKGLETEIAKDDTVVIMQATAGG